MKCEAEKRGYTKVKVVKDVSGWPIGSIVWLNEDSKDADECWNDDCTKKWYYSFNTGSIVAIGSDSQNLQLEAGKYYMTRDGRKVGPMTKDSTDEVCYGSGNLDGFIGMWLTSGTADFYTYYEPEHRKYDLIAEWHDDETDDEGVTVNIEEADPLEVFHLAVMALTEKGQYEHAMSVLSILLDMQDE